MDGLELKDCHAGARRFMFLVWLAPVYPSLLWVQLPFFVGI